MSVVLTVPDRPNRRKVSKGGHIMYIITGATGHIGSRIAKKLLESGKRVRVISRSLARLKPFIAMGAEPFEGDLADTKFLAQAFAGGEAVFSMIPPNQAAEKVRKYQNRMSKSIISAVRRAKITRVVNLSSVGARLKEKTGPIAGLHDHEEALNKIKDLHVVHLRPAFFMENLIGNIDLIKHQGIMGSALRGDMIFPIIATRDIAAEAARYLIGMSFTGKRIRFLLGQRDLSMKEMTEIIGKAIGRPELRYVQFGYEDAEKAMIGAGMSRDSARSYIEMSRAMNEGLIYGEVQRRPENTTETPFEEFVKEFAELYCADEPECLASGF
jgi:uncharacterized protein YbjT (DUF2867 family)